MAGNSFVPHGYGSVTSVHVYTTASVHRDTLSYGQPRMNMMRGSIAAWDSLDYQPICRPSQEPHGLSHLVTNPGYVDVRPIRSVVPDVRAYARVG